MTSSRLGAPRPVPFSQGMTLPPARASTRPPRPEVARPPRHYGGLFLGLAIGSIIGCAALWGEIRDVYLAAYPTDMVKREALKLCAQVNPNFIRFLAEDRASCYETALKKPVATSDTALATPEAIRPAAAVVGPPRDDERAALGEMPNSRNTALGMEPGRPITLARPAEPPKLPVLESTSPPSLPPRPFP